MSPREITRAFLVALTFVPAMTVAMFDDGMAVVLAIMSATMLTLFWRNP